MSEARRVLVLLDDTAAATAAIELSSLVARQVQRPLFEVAVNEQVRQQTERQGPGHLHDLVYSGETWTVG